MARAKKAVSFKTDVATIESKSAVKVVKPEPKQQTTYVTIDHPVNDEIVSGMHYAIRMGSSSNGTVELEINKSGWLPCRPSAGYWWYDWSHFTPGKYRLTACLKDSSGKIILKSDTCQVKVM